jgi:hypothetical protein
MDTFFSKSGQKVGKVGGKLTIFSNLKILVKLKVGRARFYQLKVGKNFE